MRIMHPFSFSFSFFLRRVYEDEFAPFILGAESVRYIRMARQRDS